MSAGTRFRWAAKHGTVRLLLRSGRKRGQTTAYLLSDPAVRVNPYPAYERIRAESRTFVRSPIGLATVSHEAAATILRSDAFGAGLDLSATPRPIRTLLRLSETKGVFGPIDPPSMLVVDPPDHTRYRRLVSKVFTARAVEGFRVTTETIAKRLLDEMDAGDGSVDLVERYASQLPVSVICEILAIPPDMHEQFLAWGNGAALSLDMGLTYPQYKRVEDDIRAANAWLHGHFARLRANPGEDLLSQLVSLVDEGDRLNEDELTATALLLLGAGFETTVNLIGNGVVALLDNPGELAALRAEPDLWGNAVEEILRFDAPVQTTARGARRDVEVCGVTIPKGRMVATILGGANRDPAVFTDPDRFDVRRANAREHLSFSSGIHYCLGSGLARLEGEIGLRMLFDRYPDLALAGPSRRRPNRTLRGFDAMPVSLGTRERQPH